MEIGAQLYTVRDYTQSEKDFGETIGKIARIGYKCVQISAAGPIAPGILRDICDGSGVRITLTHTSPDKILEDPDAIIENHLLMGAETIGIGSMPGKYGFDAVGLKNFMEYFAPAIEKIEKAGLTFGYHNHHREFEKSDGKLVIERMVETFTTKTRFIFDTYWAQYGGADPAFWIAKLKSRVDIIHLKDMLIHQGEQRDCEVMEGNLNWAGIRLACDAAGTRFGFVEQDNCHGKDPFACLKLSYDNFTEKWEGFS